MLVSKAYEDTSLAVRLAVEDRAELAGRLPVDSRVTCAVHRRWMHHCVSSPVHVNQVTGHRWCRSCSEALTVAVDELNRTVAMSCPTCGDGHNSASDRLVVACLGSLAAETGQLPAMRAA